MAKHEKNDANDRSTNTGTNFTRRRLLTGLGSLAATAAWLPAFRVSPASAQAVGAPPPNFPASIELYQQAYENWAAEIRIDALWTCAPRSALEIVAVANWAYHAGYQVRARGSMHGWSPLTITPDDGLDTRVILVDTRQHLTDMQLVSTAPTAVRVQPGALMEELLAFLELNGQGFLATPAVGEITVGGALAIDGHGTGIPAQGEVPVPGFTYGSLSNLVVSLTAVVWDNDSQQYDLRHFERGHPHCRALLTHLGRSFITEVTLRTGPNYLVRCQSITDVPAAELMAKPSSLLPRKLSSYLDSTGRVEIIWFPFTDKPWLKVWSLSPVKPLSSRAVSEPYNYPFADNIPREISDFADEMISGNGSGTPYFGQMEYAAVVAGLKAMQAEDLWGWSKNLLLYVKPTTLRVTANGYAIHTRRSNAQKVVSEFYQKYSSMLAAYRARNEYPMNGPVEIRVTGLDYAADVGIRNADAPAMSALRPRADHPEWDVAVWFDLLTFPGTPGANVFFREMEQWLFEHFAGNYAMVRPEWSKGWGYTPQAAWSDPVVLAVSIPAAFPDETGSADGWDKTRKQLNQFDPHHVFSNRFLDRLLP